MGDILEIKGISRSFIVEGTEKSVFEDVSFSVEKGEFICILGPSGCGKTTLLEMLAGFQQPDKGLILQENRRVVKPESSRIMIFQDFNQLLPWKTLYDNIMFPLRSLRKDIPNTVKKELAEASLEMVNLKGYGSYYPHQLSGGMNQRAAIARALVLQPKILLMDEPFGSLDAQTRTQLQRLLVDIWRETRVTIVFVTHDVQEAVILADRIIIMDSSPGRIREIIRNDIPKPRDVMESGCSKLYKAVLNSLDTVERQ